VTHFDLWRESERHRLVRLCAAISGDRGAAEDLAQETLLEAWRNVGKLHDPAGADRWLSAIARNVCRRWARRHGRELVAVAATDAEPAAADRGLEDVGIGDVLVRALGVLPRQTRDVLVHRYVHDVPQAEIAARLGISEDAVSMRASRGKDVLRRLLARELRDEVDDGWHETRVWCSECGRHRLTLRRDAPPGVVSFRCAGCSRDAPRAEFRLANPTFADLFGDLVRPAALLERAAEWSRRYFAGGAGSSAACVRCDRPVTLERYLHDRDGRPSLGLFATCGSCGEQVSSSARGLVFSLPEVRRFRREHPRTRAVPAREVEAGGEPAVVLRYEDLRSSAGVDVVVARRSVRVLAIHGATA